MSQAPQNYGIISGAEQVFSNAILFCRNEKMAAKSIDSLNHYCLALLSEDAETDQLSFCWLQTEISSLSWIRA